MSEISGRNMSYTITIGGKGAAAALEQQERLLGQFKVGMMLMIITITLLVVCSDAPAAHPHLCANQVHRHRVAGVEGMIQPWRRRAAANRFMHCPSTLGCVLAEAVVPSLAAHALGHVLCEFPAARATEVGRKHTKDLLVRYFFLGS